MIVFLSILAVWRISVFLVEERGPFALAARIRKIRLFKNALNCLYCTSFWVTLPFAAYLAHNRNFLIYWFGIAGAVYVINFAKEIMEEM